ncbi:hypothetical protein [Macrococcoides caseolyticum]|nr:hypothetical protein [Macrococcus caseolyticus]
MKNRKQKQQAVVNRKYRRLCKEKQKPEEVSGSKQKIPPLMQ